MIGSGARDAQGKETSEGRMRDDAVDIIEKARVEASLLDHVLGFDTEFSEHGRYFPGDAESSITRWRHLIDQAGQDLASVSGTGRGQATVHGFALSPAAAEQR